MPRPKGDSPDLSTAAESPGLSTPEHAAGRQTPVESSKLPGKKSTLPMRQITRLISDSLEHACHQYAEEIPQKLSVSSRLASDNVAVVIPSLCSLSQGKHKPAPKSLEAHLLTDLSDGRRLVAWSPVRICCGVSFHACISSLALGTAAFFYGAR
ncbi:hypothetical protein BDV06DRAFT_227437 [Aspergillus oleicola]